MSYHNGTSVLQRGTVKPSVTLANEFSICTDEMNSSMLILILCDANVQVNKICNTAK